MANLDPRESQDVMQMFRGVTIEDLINIVCRAEERARIEQEHASAVPEIWNVQVQQQERSEVV